jgi:hypothetical protein
VENKISALNEGPEEAAYYALATIAGAVGRATIKARGRYGPLPVLYSEAWPRAPFSEARSKDISQGPNTPPTTRSEPPF